MLRRSPHPAREDLRLRVSRMASRFPTRRRTSWRRCPAIPAFPSKQAGAASAKCPAELYTTSHRTYQGLPDPSYPFTTATCWSLPVDGSASIASAFNISHVLAGQKARHQGSRRGIWLSFMHYVWNISTSSRGPCNPSTTRSARGCHLCLRYDLLPMCPGRTQKRLEEGEELQSNILHFCAELLAHSLEHSCRRRDDPFGVDARSDAAQSPAKVATSCGRDIDMERHPTQVSRRATEECGRSDRRSSRRA